MHSDSVVDWRKIESVGNEFEYEFDRLVHIYSFDCVAHTIETRRLVAEHRVRAIVGCFE